MKPYALIVAGMPASGKNCARIFAKNAGIPAYSTGDIVRQVCAERGVEPTAENMGRLSDELRGPGGLGVTAEAVRRAAAANPKAPLIIFEGMRSSPEIDLFRERFEPIVVAFIVGGKLRRERYLSRGRSDDAPGAFAARDERELAYGVGNLIAAADYYILNERSLDDAVADFEKIVKGLLAAR